jgi:hypothetical protein
MPAMPLVPPRPFVLRSGDYRGRFCSTVPTLALDNLMDDHVNLDYEELAAVASELRFRMMRRRQRFVEGQCVVTASISCNPICLCAQAAY